mmetsp:Transcript_57644/g.122606  ORF Transcript_57644/g.122606 Transcript_57644/m.122606 type:complete len:470 (-) Transcript_57644:271-1680(-)
MTSEQPLLSEEDKRECTDAEEPRGPMTSEEVKNLPDLAPRLQEQGIYGDYVVWRDNYMRWRQGGSKGAKGENTVEDHQKRNEEFQTWYPTIRTFTFRRTIAFWCSVTCLEGCLLFLWIDLVTTVTIGTPEMMYELTKVPNLMGGTFFLGGIYLAWFELINIDSERIEDATYNFIWCPVSDLTKRDISMFSLVGAAGYLVGAIFYTISQVSDFFALDEGTHAMLIDWPLIIGGLLFFLSGCCELIINNVFTSPPTSLVWWVSVMNCYGGLTFWLSACPSIFPGESATIFAVTGTITYLIAAVLSLLMWRGEQFGGAMIPALNRVGHVAVKRDPNTKNGLLVIEVEGDKSKAEEALNPKLSWRGTLFLMLFASIGAFQILACCTCLNHRRDYKTNPLYFKHFLNIFLTAFVNIIIVHMVLVLNSATVTMPKKGQEPYRSLAILMRVLAILGFINSLLTLQVQFEEAENYYY